jgi:hypothetical protein
MMKLHDEVRVTKDIPPGAYKGYVGKIIDVLPNAQYKIHFDDMMDPVVIEAEHLEITKKCDICGGSLARFQSEWGKKGEDPEVLCHDCNDARVLDFYRKDKRLSTGLMMQATLRRRDEIRVEDITDDIMTYVEVIRAIDRIHELAKRFEAEVWLPTLWPYYDAAETTAHSGQTGSFKALMMSTAGRLLITIRAHNEKSEVTVITTDDGGPHMGVQSVYGTEEDAVSLLTGAIEGMPEMAPDKEVSIF